MYCPVLLEYIRLVLRACEVVANEVYSVNLKRKMSLTRAKERATSACRCRRVSEYTEIQCTVQRVQPDRGHHCGRRHRERYDSTSLFTVTYQLIYRHCTCTVQCCWSTSD
jgi:hypothetical protein